MVAVAVVVVVVMVAAGVVVAAVLAASFVVDRFAVAVLSSDALQNIIKQCESVAWQVTRGQERGTAAPN